MENNIKLSIIMPLYNVADTLQTALDSILMQEVNFNYEIIAIDDASSDSTLEILEQNAKKCPPPSKLSNTKKIQVMQFLFMTACAQVPEIIFVF